MWRVFARWNHGLQDLGEGTWRWMICVGRWWVEVVEG